MPEFLQGPQGKQPPQQPGSPNDFLSPMDKSQVVAQAVPPGPPPQAPQGVPQGAGFGATQENPLEAPEEEASEQEQAQYDDLFVRVMAAVNDTRTPQGGGPSPADAVIKLMSVKGKEAHVAIGQAVGMIMTQMIDLAKRSGVEYDGRVVQEVGIDLTEELAEIAKVSGAIANMPEEESDGWIKLIELSVLEASKFFGEWLLRTGQADRQGHMAEIEEQMQREADSGALDDWGMEELDPQMRQQIAQQVQPQQGGMPPQGGMPNG